MPVHFSGVDWDREQDKAEAGFQKRKHSKQEKKKKKMEVELLRRFRRFLHGMPRQELENLLTPHVVANFYGELDVQRRNNDVDVQRRNTVIAQLASDDILENRRPRAALLLLREDMVDLGTFSSADDFLESLFAFPPDDLRALVDSHIDLFRGPLELIYSRGDYGENLRLFLEQNLRVGHLGRQGGDAMMELRQILIDGEFLNAEPDGTVSTLSADSLPPPRQRRWRWQLPWRRRRQRRQERQ